MISQNSQLLAMLRDEGDLEVEELSFASIIENSMKLTERSWWLIRELHLTLNKFFIQCHVLVVVRHTVKLAVPSGCYGIGSHAHLAILLLTLQILQEPSLASPSLVKHLAEFKHGLAHVLEWLLEGIADEVKDVSKTSYMKSIRKQSL